MRNFNNAFFSSVHQVSGCCSANPGSGARIGISTSGEKALATGAPLSASTRAAFTEEEPMSKPRRYLRMLLFCTLIE